MMRTLVVIPAEAGTQIRLDLVWIPVSTGMTILLSNPPHSGAVLRFA